MVPKLYTLTEIAQELRYTGRDRERSVRRLFRRHQIPFLRRDRATILITDQQFRALVEAMKCSPCVSEAGSTTSVARSVLVAKPAGSKSTLRMRSPRGCGGLPSPARARHPASPAPPCRRQPSASRDRDATFRHRSHLHSQPNDRTLTAAANRPVHGDHSCRSAHQRPSHLPAQSTQARRQVHDRQATQHRR